MSDGAKGSTVYAMTFRLPLLVWSALFFLGPLLFMAAMSFFLVKNYRMTEAFETVNWARMLSRGYFWDSWRYTLGMAAAGAAAASLIAFPAAWTLAFRAGATQRRWAISLLIIPFFTSYLVRVFAWFVILAEAGPINAVIGGLGAGPVTMLNTPFGTLVGYLTLTLPLVVILQTLALSGVDRDQIAAARNLGCPPGRLLTAVVLPAAKTGLVIAALICFILSFGDFVSPYYLGGSTPPTLPILIIDTTKSGQQWPRAAVVALMMMATLITIAFAAVTYAYAKRGTRA
ncbi:MAG: ABC transporter permease [Pseudomonadota bacterium]